MKEKICIFCKHWYFQPQEADWSDVTPGDKYEEGCEKGHWSVEQDWSMDYYRKKILTAERCPDYEFFKETP